MKNISAFTIFFFISILSFSQNEKYYKENKNYTHGKIKQYNYADKSWSPLGVDVLVIYNTFFKNYTVTYKDSKGLEQKMIFDSTPESKENYLTYNNMKWKVDSGLQDYFKDFSGYIFFASPYDAGIGDYKYQYDITFNME